MWTARQWGSPIHFRTNLCRAAFRCDASVSFGSSTSIFPREVAMILFYSLLASSYFGFVYLSPYFLLPSLHAFSAAVVLWHPPRSWSRRDARRRGPRKTGRGRLQQCPKRRGCFRLSGSRCVLSSALSFCARVPFGGLLRRFHGQQHQHQRQQWWQRWRRQQHE